MRPKRIVCRQLNRNLMSKIRVEPAVFVNSSELLKFMVRAESKFLFLTLEIGFLCVRL